MPRSGGVYTLPSGYTAVTGATITATQHNTPLEDIASALTDSLPVDGTKAMTGELLLSGNAANNLGAVPKQQLDATVAGLLPKSLVVVATTANITLSGEQTIDGILTSASRVLVKDQSTASQNGIYVSGAGSWTRATDMDAWAEVPGALVIVSRGTTQGDTAWLGTADAGGTLGSTSVTFSRVGVSDGDRGDITVSGNGATFTIDNNAVTYAKMQDASAGNVVLARAAATSGDYAEVSLAASRLLGRGSTGDIAAISLGTGLSFSGTVLSASGGILDTQTFTANGTWNKPASGTWLLLEGVGSGAGGGGGGSGGTQGAGGGGGGAGVAGWYLFRLADLAATETVVVPAGGTGGATATNGGAGSDASFGSWAIFRGGALGGGGTGTTPGTAGDGGSGGGGGGGNSGTGGNGGAAGNAGTAGGSGGAGGNGVRSNSVVAAVPRIAQPGGGGGGGGRTGTTTVAAGGTGGAATSWLGAGGAGGAAVNGTGAAGSNATGPGGGGGGGGGGVTGGAGGNGFRGEIRAYVF
jgi:hypothetical protein